LFICAALVAGEGVLPESDASDLLDTGNVCTQNFCLGGEIFELMLVANPCDPPGSDLDDCVDDYCSDDAECVGHLRPGYAACSVDADSAPTDAVLCGPDPDTGTSRCQGRCNSVGTCWACVPEVCDGLDNDCDGDTDEDVTAACQYHGPTGTEGVGTCKGGVAKCVDGSLSTPHDCADGSTSVCSGGMCCCGEVLPARETCDGVDTDCDGLPDAFSVITPEDPAGFLGTENELYLNPLCDWDASHPSQCATPPDHPCFGALARPFSGTKEQKDVPYGTCGSQKHPLTGVTSAIGCGCTNDTGEPDGYTCIAFGNCKATLAACSDQSGPLLPGPCNDNEGCTEDTCVGGRCFTVPSDGDWNTCEPWVSSCQKCGPSDPACVE
jgi:hypothetical protein